MAEGDALIGRTPSRMSGTRKWSAGVPLHPQVQGSSLLRHVVVPVIVARLNSAKPMRLNLRANIAGNAKRGHVGFSGAPQVSHRKRPAFELVCSQHGLLDLFDQTGHGFLAQRHASIRAEKRRLDTVRLSQAPADDRHQIFMNGQDMPARVGMPIPPLGVQQRRRGAGYVDQPRSQAQQVCRKRLAEAP